MIINYLNQFIPKLWTLLKRGYSLPLLKNDLFAGITVGIVALPLSMAFAIASGVTPEKGLYTAIIAGFLVSLLGGCRHQIAGPTGAFVALIYGIVQHSGYDGLVLATLVGGIFLLIAAFTKCGRIIKYVPYPLVIGFTTGIALLIFSSQVKEFLGLEITSLPPSFFGKWKSIFAALPSLHLPTFGLASLTLGLMMGIRRFFPKLPWGVTSITIATLIAWGFNLPVATIATQFGEIKSTLPHFNLPIFNFSHIPTLLRDGLMIAFLAGIESLLSAVVADGMAGTKHKSNCELMAQGIANIGSALFGGIPATGAIARTATNIKSGAKTPLAGIFHAATLILLLLVLAPIGSQIPLASLSALLIVVAWNMSEIHHFRHLLKTSPSDILVLFSTFLVTVFVDLTYGVAFGMIIALFLLIAKTRTFRHTFKLTTLEKHIKSSAEIEICEIKGPFFFGAVDQLKTFPLSPGGPKIFILKMPTVSFIDASGLNAIKELYYKCQKGGTSLHLCNVNEPVLESLKKYGLVDLIGEKQIFPHLNAALK